jgi:four helix bundle protein
MATTDYATWENAVPVEIRNDVLWRVTAYRLALFLADLAWHDVTKLMKDRRTFSLSDQLYRSVGSTGANISEGYSRGTSKDRARFYEYALGSAREARGWYFDGRHVLGSAVAQHRIRLCTEIIRLLLTMIPQQRSYTAHDEVAEYVPNQNLNNAGQGDGIEQINNLLQNVPLPEP